LSSTDLLLNLINKFLSQTGTSLLGKPSPNHFRKVVARQTYHQSPQNRSEDIQYDEFPEIVPAQSHNDRHQGFDTVEIFLEEDDHPAIFAHHQDRSRVNAAFELFEIALYRVFVGLGHKEQYIVTDKVKYRRNRNRESDIHLAHAREDTRCRQTGHTATERIRCQYQIADSTAVCQKRVDDIFHLPEPLVGSGVRQSPGNPN